MSPKEPQPERIIGPPPVVESVAESIEPVQPELVISPPPVVETPTEDIVPVEESPKLVVGPPPGTDPESWPTPGTEAIPQPEASAGFDPWYSLEDAAKIARAKLEERQATMARFTPPTPGTVPDTIVPAIVRPPSEGVYPVGPPPPSDESDQSLPPKGVEYHGMPPREEFYEPGTEEVEHEEEEV